MASELLPYRRLLVTGGCGFIGSNLVRDLLSTQPRLELVNLDALTYAGNLENLADVMQDSRLRFVHGRVEDVDACREALHGVDAVVHLAAETHVDRSILGPQVFVTTNVLGTQVLLDVALAAGVKRLLHVSTDEVYGPAPEGVRFDEDAPFRPSSPYAATKAAADLMALAHARTHGMDLVVTRCTNNYGPFQFPEKLIPLVITNALNREPVPVYGDGRQVRDWLHVQDHCRAMQRVLGRGRAGVAYNVAGDSPMDNLELVQAVLDGLGAPRSLIRHVADRPAHDRRYALDCARLRSELDWRPEHQLEQGLRQTIAWYRANRSWWERVQDGSYREFYRQQYGQRLDEGAGG